MSHCWDDVISAGAREMYRPYERERRVGERPALLAIDLYNLVYERDHPSSCGEFAWAAIAPTRRDSGARRKPKRRTVGPRSFRPWIRIP